MMERRFKLVAVSMHIVASYGKDFPLALTKALGEDSRVIKQEDSIMAGALLLLVYNPKYPKLGNKELVPTMDIDIKPKEKSSILLMN